MDCQLPLFFLSPFFLSRSLFCCLSSSHSIYPALSVCTLLSYYSLEWLASFSITDQDQVKSDAEYTDLYFYKTSSASDNKIHFKYKCFTDCKVGNQTIDVLFKVKTKYCDSLQWLLSLVCRCHLILYTAYVIKFRHFLALHKCSNTFCDHSVPKGQRASNPSCFFFILFSPHFSLKDQGGFPYQFRLVYAG